MKIGAPTLCAARGFKAAVYRFAVVFMVAWALEGLAASGSFAQTKYVDDTGRFALTIPVGAEVEGKTATLKASGAVDAAYCWPSKWLLAGAPATATQADLNNQLAGFIERNRQMPTLKRLSSRTTELQGVTIVESTWSLVVAGKPARSIRRNFSLMSSVGAFVGELDCGFSVEDEAFLRPQVDAYLSSLRFIALR